MRLSHQWGDWEPSFNSFVGDFLSVEHPRRHFALWYFTVIVTILNPKHNNISWFGLSSFSSFFSVAQKLVRILVMTTGKGDLAQGKSGKMIIDNDTSNI